MSLSPDQPAGMGHCRSLDDALLGSLYDEIGALREAVLADAEQMLRLVDGERARGRVNLAHYLALRGRDLRSLQERLACCALSSLGRSEAHVAATLDGLLALLAAVLDRRSCRLCATSACACSGRCRRIGPAIFW